MRVRRRDLDRHKAGLLRRQAVQIYGRTVPPPVLCFAAMSAAPKTTASPFKSVNPRQSFPALEEEILNLWRERQIFEKSTQPIDSNTGETRKPFVFYEGPPTANGKPGIHHVLSRAFKDVIPRYKTMCGYRVDRKAGWDCHGLPVEVEVEKRLGLRGKQQIEELGIGKFNALCRESVMQYIGDWDRLTARIAFWLDTKNPYRTLDNDYIESCWALLQQLWNRSLLVKDYKVTKHCPRCGTSLAEAEAGQGMRDDVEDPSVYVRMRLLPGQALPGGLSTETTPAALLVWTTTPWTLPANTACALNKDATYGVFKVTDEKAGKDEYLILLEALAPAVLKGHKFEAVATATGADFAGLAYEPLFAGGVNLLGVKVDTGAAYRTLVDPTVEIGDGSGIVHIAPAYGDLDVGRRHGLPVLFSVGLDGMVLPVFAKFAGKFFKEADPLITRDLKERGLLFSSGRIKHSYPFCWRCDTPLLYFAKESWYIKTTAVRDQMIEQNKQINWYPDHIKEGRFGDWLRNNVDWAISRERYWGTPLPLWLCDGCGALECIGSVDELSRRAGRDLRKEAGLDLHRPWVDGVTWGCTACQGGTLRRIKDVIDCWFDSGAMPYAQHHYPIEHKDDFAALFPAAFICEGVDQTRGWFYTLHALGVLFRGEPAFRNCIVVGHILDEQGRKMSKRLGNIVDPWSVLDVEGSDALRYYLYTASPPGQPRRFSQALVQKSLRQFLLTLWNCYSFFVTYAETEWHKLGTEPLDVRALKIEDPALRQFLDLDFWILGELHALVEQTTRRLEAYDIMAAARGVGDFVDTLSNWYIRRSRERFWWPVAPEQIGSETELVKRAAYQTLRTCLLTIAQLTAPFTPFIAEELWRNLSSGLPGAAESVHLSRWPQCDAALIAATQDIRRDMDVVMKVVSLGRAVRIEQNIKVRQPLAKVFIQIADPFRKHAATRYERIICDELNVEQVSLLEDGEQIVRYTLRPNLPKLGKKYGKRVKPIQDALLGADAQVAARVAAGVLKKENVELGTADGTFTLEPDEVLLSAESPPGLAARAEEGIVVGLPTEISPELRDRGIARELVRSIGELRKKAGCRITERVQVGYSLSGSDEGAAIVAGALQKHLADIATATQSELAAGTLTGAGITSSVEFDDATCELSLRRIG